MGERDARDLPAGGGAAPYDALPDDVRSGEVGHDGDRPATTRAHARGWLRLRLMLGALWATVAVAVLLQAPLAATPDDLVAAVEQGRVTEVTLVGGLGPEDEGWSSVDVRWREGLLVRRAEVVEERRAEGAVVGSDAFVVEDVEAFVREAAPVAVSVRREPLRTGTSVLEVPVPPWAALGFAVLWVTSLALVVDGPRPWRATRWAWFWLSPVPFGMLLFVLLSGPLPGRWSVEPPGRRLTGGWAFLLTLVLSAVLPAPLWW